jgi:hypothetical protein
VINFRYHVVSLTAVFLALAIGLVVGTAALNGPLADSLNDQVNALRSDNQRLRQEADHLKTDANAQEQFAAEAAPALLRDTLTGKRVLILADSSGGDLANGVQEMLAMSGATLTGRVDIQGKFNDPGNNDHLLDLVTQLLPPTVTGLPTNSDGVETASALLAVALMDRTPALSTDSARAVLAGFKDAGYITYGDTPPGPAQAVIVVSGSPFIDRDASKKNANVLTTVDQFDRAAPLVVVAEAPSGDGNVVGAVRGDPTLSKTISTVDNASTTQGQVASILALTEQLSGGSGHYGIGAGNTSMLPKLDKSPQ